MPANVTAEPDRLVIEGVPAFTYREGRDSLVLAMNAAAHSLGRAVSYAGLKGRSGLAFRLIFHQDWHRFTPDALCGYDHTGALLGALGLQGALVQVGNEDQTAGRDAQDLIRRSLESGYPVLGIHLMDYEDWGVITGITADGRLLCQTPHNEGDEAVESKNWPPLLLRITAEEEREDPRSLLESSLRIAVKLHGTSHFGPFFSGRGAFRFWIDSLRDEAAFERLEKRGEQPYEAWVRELLREDKDNFALDTRYSSPYLERAHVNTWRLESLIDARNSAAEYLRLAAEDFTGKAKTRLTAAAEQYDRQVAVLTGARANVTWEWNLTERPWTAEMRAAQADALSEALRLESAAMKEIRTFLSKNA